LPRIREILIVDDDPTTAGLLKTLLELDGYAARTVHASSEVIPTLEQDPPDMVLMDVRLRGRDGFEVLAEIRKHPRLQSMPVMLMSGIDYRQQARRAGADGFLSKPFNPDDMVRLLTKISSQTDETASTD
jgi:two-component system sensor histidine kinase/response regulator